jgi:hypothetical protein
MGCKRASWKVLVCVAWVVFAALLELLAVVDLVASIVESDSQFVRKPVALIVVAAITWAVCTVALAAAVRGLRGRDGGFPAPIGVALTVAAVAMTGLFAVTSIATGPL